MLRRDLFRYSVSVMTLSFLGLLEKADAASIDDFIKTLDSLSQGDLINTLGDIEAYQFSLFREERRRGQPLQLKPSNLSVSQAAKRLIIEFEVSGRANYETRLKSPIWPGGESGITIGIGYDLGYVRRNIFRSDWDGLIDASTIDRLEKACLVKRRDAKNEVGQYSDIVIDWDTALKAFDKILPLYAAETEAAFPNCSKLSTDSFGALVSLVYNRGGSTKVKSQDKNDRRFEMKQIQNLMAIGDTQSLKAIPEQLRNMTRLWDAQTQAGLLKRRELEALLFEAGIHV